jgi:hypothetical protein
MNHGKGDQEKYSHPGPRPLLGSSYVKSFCFVQISLLLLLFRALLTFVNLVLQLWARIISKSVEPDCQSGNLSTGRS